MSDSPDKQEGRGRGTADTRRERIPFGVPQSRLTVANTDPSFVYRWVNDDGKGRIDRAVAGGYEFVQSEADQKVGSGSADGNSDVGSKVSRIVGTSESGGGMRAYLMRIKKEWYDEDQRRKQKEGPDMIEAAIRRGTLNQSGDDNRYIPSEGIAVNSKLMQRAKTA